MGAFTLQINEFIALQAWDVTSGGGGTTPTQLAAPANLRQSSATSTSNVVAWDARSNASGYELRRASTTIYSGPATNFEDTGLTPATAYSYTVRALGSGSYSNSVYSPTLTATTAAVATVPFKLLAEGNSLSANSDSWVSKLAAARSADSTFSIQNLATGGEAWAQINSDGEHATLVASKATSGITAVVGWEGINSILGGGLSGQPNYDSAKSFYSFCTASGMRSAAVIITTARKRGNGDGYEQAVWQFVQDYNALQRSGFDSGDLGALVLVDLQSVPVFAGYDGPLNTDFFYDGLHYTQAGQEIVAKMMGRAADALRAGVKTIITWQASDGGAIAPQPLALTLAPNATYDAPTKKYDYAGPLDNSWQPLGLGTQVSSSATAEDWVEVSPVYPENAGFSIGFNDTPDYRPSFQLLAGCIAIIDANAPTTIAFFPLVNDFIVQGAALRLPAVGTKYRVWRKDKKNGDGLRVYLMELVPTAGAAWSEVYDFGSVGGTLYVQVKINARSDAGISNILTYGLT